MRKSSTSQIQEYYTPKMNEMQGFLVIFTFFVDYAYIYVNMIMLTQETKELQKHLIFMHLHRCWVSPATTTTKYRFCKATCKKMHVGK